MINQPVKLIFKRPAQPLIAFLSSILLACLHCPLTAASTLEAPLATARSTTLLLSCCVCLTVALVFTSVVAIRARTKASVAAQAHTLKLEQIRSQWAEEVATLQEQLALQDEARHYYLHILNSLPAIMIGLDDQQRVTLWNNTAVRSLDITPEQALKSSIFTLVPGLSEFSEAISVAITNQITTVNESAQLELGQRTCYANITIFPLPHPSRGAVLLIDDITKQFEVEQYLIQNEKMLSLGRMAAGMAHEINNPMSAVLSNLQSLQRRLSSDLPQNKTVADTIGLNLDQLAEYLSARGINPLFDNTREAIERAATTVRNMLSFSHTGEGAEGPEPINQLIRDVVDLENQFNLAEHPELSPVQLDLAAEPDVCLCSPPEIQQVILNLLRNAYQACANEPQEAQVMVRTRSDGPEIIIEVSDNGRGIEAEHLSKIFDPFFTTKAIGDGTGLGLSIAYLIITQHHRGTIEVSSTLGSGTVFCIRLPLMQNH